ncbi:hypothetical protein JK192_02980 [Gluconobacter cerinus]|uniref:hypothetical protein n=1 Tax=Gluconobacter cerinus TaxID=38307 RepID=UPI001B8D2813|nr:hypothetical protein [Gluconobacter cerinus]MBS1030353.1 hypothetical protein [Gluconobacter cerinus]
MDALLLGSTLFAIAFGILLLSLISPLGRWINARSALLEEQARKLRLENDHMSAP